MRKKVVWTSSIFLWMAVSCVTVNIYFPAAAAEKAADVIIDDIQGKDKAPERPPEQQPQKKSGQPPKQGGWLDEQLKGVAFGPAVAYAAEMDLNISTPAIRSIRESLRARYAELSPHFDNGVLGYTNTGLIGIRDASGLSLGDRARLSRLVDQQNQDLKSLYGEIAKENKFGADGVPKLQKIFADRWRERAKPGRWIQTDDGAWVKK